MDTTFVKSKSVRVIIEGKFEDKGSKVGLHSNKTFCESQDRNKVNSLKC